MPRTALSSLAGALVACVLLGIVGCGRSGSGAPPGGETEAALAAVRTKLEAAHSQRDAAAFAAKPIWIFHGAVDPALDVDQSRRLAGALENASSDARYTELPTAGHNDAAETAYNLDVFKWLFAQHRPPHKQ